MKRDLIEVFTSLMGGAAMGAMAMYLLDPAEGESRRRYLRRQAGEMLSEASDYASQAGDKMRRLRQSATDYAAQAGDSLTRGRQQLERRLRAAASRRMESDESTVLSGSTVGIALGMLGLGAGLMFLMDPVSGRRRRSLIRDKAVHYAHETTDSLSATGRHLSNRAKGVYHEASSMMGRHQRDGGHQLGAVEEKGRPVGR
jgi:hypothetical protein